MARDRRGWHGERKRHSDAARKRNVPRIAHLPTQALDVAIVNLIRDIKFMKEKRQYLLEDRVVLEMLNDRILLKEEQLKAMLPERQVELI